MPRTLLLSGMLVGVALAIACGRTEMETLVRAAASSGTDASTTSSGGTGDAASGPCAEATCLTSFFQTCVPEGSCYLEGGGTATTSDNTACYANGVTVSYVESYDGPNVTRNLTVRRHGVLCYSIDDSTPTNTNGTRYVVRGADGEEVATGALVDKSGSATVTCTGGQPTAVPGACLRPVGNNDACTPGTCL
jgi:hypothetical protein